jgi:hypothetical protein
VIRPIVAFDYDVIYIRLDVSTNLRLEYLSSHSSESWASILQAFRHSNETESTKGHDEASLFLILFHHPTLMITRETIQKRHDSGVGCRINDLIRPWKWEIIFGRGLI